MKTKGVWIVAALALGVLTMTGVMLCLNAQSSLASPAKSSLAFPTQDDAITVCLEGGCDYDTIQAAVDAARPGVTIKVAAGTYAGVDGRPAPAGYPFGTVVTQVVYIAKSVTVQGGYTVTNWITPDLKTNPTTLDADGRGRVVFIAGPAAHPTLAGLRLTDGDARGQRGHPGFPDTDAGGGAYVFSSTATITSTQVFSNVAEWGAGLYLYQSDATLIDNAVFSHTASALIGGGGLYLYESPAVLSANTVFSNAAGRGGGLYLHRSPARLTENLVLSNTAEAYGGGLRLERSAAALSGNRVEGNRAQFGGGLYLYGSDARLSGNTVSMNTADPSYGGGLYLHRSDAVLTGNLIISNTAALFGGGLHVYLGSDAMLVNTVVADNHAGDSGSGLYVWRSSPRLLHTTIARNAGGDGSGLVIRNDGQPLWTVTLTNTIMVSHSVGISVSPGGVVDVNGILWDSDTITRVWRSPLTTTVTLRNEHEGDPGFGPDGYHLLPESDAIDHGVDSDVGVDIDGEPRPRGARYDLGADEAGPLLFSSFTHSGPDWLGQQTIFTNTTVASEPVSYTWDFGDSTSSTVVSPIHAYTAPGSYTVVLTATSSGLEGVATGTVVIYAASFDSSSPDWLGQTTVFTNTSQATAATDYLWSFGDQLTSALESPTHAYTEPGVYTAILTATNAEGSGVATGAVTVYSAPIVDFSASPTEGVVPLDVSFTSMVSTTPAGDPTLAYLWHFGDAGTSTLSNPMHTYATTGTYTVTLQVSNTAGSAVEIKERYITVTEGGVTYDVYLPLVLNRRR